MARIFPGMDPYLEHPDVWPGFHNRLVVYITNHLQPLLRPRYIAVVEGRVYLASPEREVIPDIRIQPTQAQPVTPQATTAVLEADAPELLQVPIWEQTEGFVTILDKRSGKRVVTVIEVVSPTNKYAGRGREAYLEKQRDVLASKAHLVEIDLLRHGPHVLAVPEPAVRMRYQYDYLISVSRAAGVRDQYELYPRLLRQPLPRIRVPLADGDPDVTLDLQSVLATAYDDANYRELLDYHTPCVPPLPAADQAWADELIRAASVPG
jgi:hypothetical protein